MNIWLISDTHFGHKNILTFRRKDGTPLRPHSSIEEHDQCLIDNWNRVVGKSDKVYHLGDVGFFNVTRFDQVFSQLNGTKVLIKGNHDILKAEQWLRHFKDIRAYHMLDKVLLAHVPVHPLSLDRWRGQVHGHLHDNDVGDSRYFNVSCEKINYTPINFEEVRQYYLTK